MDTLRKPLLFFAITIIALVVTLETGSTLLLQQASTAPPGNGIMHLALVDGLVLFTTLLMASPLLISHRLQGRVQGIATLIFSILLLLAGIALAFAVILKLIIMVTLLTTFPFGTIAYLAIYAKFDTANAAVILSMIMTLKLIFSGCLVFAHQRFIENKGLVLIVLTSLIATLVVNFLHALPPSFLVSITDAIAAIIVAIIAIIWLIFFLIGSLTSMVKAIG